MANSLLILHTEEDDEEDEQSPNSSAQKQYSTKLDGGLGKRTIEKLSQIRKVVEEAKQSTSLNFAEREDEEDGQYTPSQGRSASYLNLTNGGLNIKLN